jgi:chromosome segregation ATPase
MSLTAQFEETERQIAFHQREIERLQREQQRIYRELAKERGRQNLGQPRQSSFPQQFGRTGLPNPFPRPSDAELAKWGYKA